MTGTPTQYYGFPTYADSDAVDLTAQYNTAVTNIDSELHQLDVNSRSRTRNLVILGDSWAANDSFNSWVTTLAANLGATKTINTAVSGAGTAAFTAQAEDALVQLDGEFIDYLVVIGGVNDFVTSGTLQSACNNVEKAFNTIKVNGVGLSAYLPNCALLPATGDGGIPTYIEPYKNAFAKLDVPETHIGVSYNILDSFYPRNYIDSSNRTHPNTAGVNALSKLVELALHGMPVTINDPVRRNTVVSGGHGVVSRYFASNTAPNEYTIDDDSLFSFVLTHINKDATGGFTGIAFTASGKLMSAATLKAPYDGTIITYDSVGIGEATISLYF